MRERARDGDRRKEKWKGILREADGVKKVSKFPACVRTVVSSQRAAGFEVYLSLIRR